MITFIAVIVSLWVGYDLGKSFGFDRGFECGLKSK
jgi:hypothetical protein